MSDKIPACAGMTAFVIFQAAVKVLQRLQPKIHPIRQPEKLVRLRCAALVFFPLGAVFGGVGKVKNNQTWHFAVFIDASRHGECQQSTFFKLLYACLLHGLLTTFGRFASSHLHDGKFIGS